MKNGQFFDSKMNFALQSIHFENINIFSEVLTILLELVWY